jgi:hypothetical protein
VQTAIIVQSLKTADAFTESADRSLVVADALATWRNPLAESADEFRVQRTALA